jgi:hypothetical protein
MMRTWRVMLPLACTLMLALVAPAPGADAASGSAATSKAQRRLNTLHCNAGPVDGKRGMWTRSAVIRFQSRHGLAQNGFLGASTRKKLYAGAAQRCDVRRVPSRSGTGRRIVLSQQQNWVWVVGAHNRVLAQGGIVDNPGELRRGSYHTGSYCGRSARVRLNHSGSLLLDNFVRFAPCGFGFHRIPRNMSNRRQMHADYFLGTNLTQSHGCIRLSAAMAKRIWNFTASRRTSVRVL